MIILINYLPKNYGLMELSNLENKFDLIILHDLLEQAKEPKLLLENLSNFLSDTGSMVATVKNFLCLKQYF